MVWLIILAILLLLAILPLGITARYASAGFSLKIMAGPFRFALYPRKKKDPAKTKEKKVAKKDKKRERSDKEQDTQTGGSLKEFLPLIKLLPGFLNRLRKKIRVKRLELKVTLAGEDPCDLALNYGRANAALGNLLPRLEHYFVIKKRDLDVQCDFTASETLLLARADITITLGRLLGLLIRYGVKAIIELVKMKNQRKGGATK